MKKIFINITILLTLTFAFVVTGCKKEETIESSISNPSLEQNLNEIPDNNPIIDEPIPIKGATNLCTADPVNPFDRNQEYIRNMFQVVVDFLSTIEDNPDYEDYEVFMNDFERLIEPYQRNSPYPKSDIAKYSGEKQRVVENLMVRYMYNIETFGLEAATKEVEKTISLMSDQEVRQNMYSVVSQLHFSFDFLDNLGDLKRPSWDERFMNCLKKKGGEFEDSNLLEKAICLLAGAPCPLTWMASCAYDATFRPNLHHTSFPY